jgi:hypothetical protein
MKREFLQKGHVYDPYKHKVDGWFVSYKYDGMRCLWDGGVTRGLPIGDVPWANRFRDQYEYISTGLWSLYGKPILAPPGFLNKLPVGVPLDGELYHPDGFQATTSAIKGHAPTFDGIVYRVIEPVSLEIILGMGEVNWFSNIKNLGCYQWVVARGQRDVIPYSFKFRDSYKWMVDIDCWNEFCDPIRQFPILGNEVMDDVLSVALERGYEGLMLRNPDSYYVCQRSRNLLKVKPFVDAEGVVVGYADGKGKHEGRVGALIVESNIGGKIVKHELGTGLTDSDRENPPSIGSIVTYRYHRLTDDGTPREARYYRKRVEI